MSSIPALDPIQTQSNQGGRAVTASELAQARTAAEVEFAQARAEFARAQAEARRAQAEAQRAMAEARSFSFSRGGSLVPPSGPTRRQEAMMFTGFLVVAVLVTVIIRPLIGAFARRLEGGKNQPAMDRESAAQLQRIEHTVEAMAVEIERLSEGQRFTTKLLSSRAEAERVIPQ